MIQGEWLAVAFAVGLAFGLAGSAWSDAPSREQAPQAECHCVWADEGIEDVLDQAAALASMVSSVDGRLDVVHDVDARLEAIEGECWYLPPRQGRLAARQ